MTRKAFLVTVLALAGMASASSSQSQFGTRIDSDPRSLPAREQPSVQERSIRRVGGAPLASLLRDSDRVLTVVAQSEFGLEVPPPEGTTLAEWKTLFSDVVAVVDVTERTSKVSDEGDWITSTVTATLVDVLKQPQKTALHAGERVSFPQSGGEIQLDGKIVRAVFSHSQPLLPGHRYLLFVLLNDDGRWNAGPSEAYEIEEGRLRALRRRTGRPADAIESNEHEQSVRDLIRVASSKPRPGA